MKFKLAFFMLFLLAFPVMAHGDSNDESQVEIHNNNFLSVLPNPVDMILYSLAITSAVIGISLLTKLSPKGKKVAFILISVPVILSTLYLGGYTVYENIISETGGPVHWHLDYEVWVCGERLDLINPRGLENKIGTSELHEHNDDQIHVEGTLIKKSEADLHSYFEAIGGRLTKEELVYPTEEKGIVDVKNGDLCNGVPGTLQAFLYKVDGNVFTQQKLADFPEYIMSPESLVPPGDCVIIEFGEERPETEKLCLTYQVAFKKGEIIRG
jgi:hypothetical protein